MSVYWVVFEQSFLYMRRFLQDKDEPERWSELKRQEAEYERRRAQLAAYHESVRHAQAVQVDDIPLPTLQVYIYFHLIMNLDIYIINKTFFHQVPDNLIYGNMPSQIPLPLEMTPSIVPMPQSKPVGILKKDTVYKVYKFIFLCKRVSQIIAKNI